MDQPRADEMAEPRLDPRSASSFRQSGFRLRRLGVHRGGMAPGPGCLPAGARRMLGLHRREASLHPLRPLSLRGSVAARGRYLDSSFSMGNFFDQAILVMAARAAMGA